MDDAVRSKAGKSASPLLKRVDNVGLGMVQRVENLLRRQAHIYRLQHRAHHRHGEKGFEIAVAVPIHESHGIALPDAELLQAVGQPPQALEKLAIGEARMIAIDDLLIARRRHRRMQQLLDQQRIGIRRRRDFNGLQRHPGLLVVLVKQQA